jgi:hypothetical protein
MSPLALAPTDDLFFLYWLDEHRGENEEECVDNDDGEYQCFACRSANITHSIQHPCQKTLCAHARRGDMGTKYESFRNILLVGKKIK